MKNNILIRIFRFYYEGFRNLDKLGKQVWLIILVKLLIMFLVLKLFFFKDFLNSKFDSEEQKSEFILEQLTK